MIICYDQFLPDEFKIKKYVDCGIKVYSISLSDRVKEIIEELKEEIGKN